MRTTLIIGVLATVAGCGVTKNNFGSHFLEVNCERMEECQKGAFEILYTSVDDCVARLEADQIALDACNSEACVFDKDNASQCVDEVKNSDCGDIEDGTAYTDCTEVWIECDGSEVDCALVGTTPETTTTTTTTTTP